MNETFRIAESDLENGMFVVDVLDGGAFFEGHFPGRPVLPAVAQLLLIDLLQRELPGGGRVAGVETLRCQGTVTPGQRLAVRLSLEPGSARLGFDISVIEEQAGPVSKGKLVLEEVGS